MDKMIYEKLGEVTGHLKAEFIECFLEAEGIDVELFQESITRSSYTSSLGLVQIYVPKTKVVTARELLASFEEFQLEEDEGSDEEE